MGDGRLEIFGEDCCEFGAGWCGWGEASEFEEVDTVTDFSWRWEEDLG